MKTDKLEGDDRRRYIRTLQLEEIGLEGQQRLLTSRVLIAGTGALGSIAAMYLAASGVGHLTLVDFDTIDISNLQRQLSFDTASCGRKKAEAAAERIHAINPGTEITVIDKMLTRDNAPALIAGHDLVIEGSDNPPTKYMVTDTCAELGIPYVIGGVAQFRGQLTCWRPGYPTYRDIFPEAAPEGGYTPCSLGGILGPLPGIIASAQACEAIKILSGAGEPLYGRLLLLDTLHPAATIIDL